MTTRLVDSPRTESLKKGIASWHKKTSPEELGWLNVGWYYNWRPAPKIPEAPGVEFVPMFWNSDDLTPENLEAVRRSPATHVLGFNEPDMDGQARMTPAECLAAWPKLMALPQRLGSPAPATASWLNEFMPEAKRLGLRVDFVCVHRYPDISDPGAVDGIEAMLHDAWEKFRLPVWLTECGAADVAAWHQPRLRKPTPTMARNFLRKLLALLERLPFVERYAWFADRVGDEYHLGSIFDPRRSRLTKLGEIYRDGH